MLEKVLIANRGEIAIRIMRACKELGIPTVAVYSDADKTSLFVRYADEKVHIGPAPSAESYLVKEKIIEAALDTGADGIHPGYGFMAENFDFAQMCVDNNIEFIGPPVDAMKLMCSKIDSKKSMIKAGVNVVAGVTEAITDHEKAKDIAHEIGYPIMLKASAGGGGIGIVKVDSSENMEEELEKVRRLAKSSFGDDAVFIEQYIHEPHHVEFQIIGDKHGNLIHVYDRECSVQRRNQKLIEETPSQAISQEIRMEMGEQAKLAANTAGYYNAGTCEFMYKDGKYYFLEMNTRLQVEHPVTEMITGVDLAREMLRVGSGLELEYKQEDIKVKGHSIECRINFEDPAKNFMPCPGTISRYAEPSGPGVRVDSGIYQGFKFPPYYDSMGAKLIVWAEDRPRAIERMKRALWEFQIGGVKTNIPFHEVVMNDPVFKAGIYDTSYIPNHNIMDKVVKYIEEKKSLGGNKKIAAAMAAVETVVAASQS